jgi:hypothetical protein
MRWHLIVGILCKEMRSGAGRICGRGEGGSAWVLEGRWRGGGGKEGTLEGDVVRAGRKGACGMLRFIKFYKYCSARKIMSNLNEREFWDTAAYFLVVVKCNTEAPTPILSCFVFVFVFVFSPSCLD